MNNVLWEHRIQDKINSAFHKVKLISELAENEQKLSEGGRWGRTSQIEARAFAKSRS